MNLFAPPAIHPHTPYKVAWLSGASDPWSCALAEDEANWLSSLGLPAAHVLDANFPYTGPRQRRCVPLALASVANLAQFGWASTPLWRRAAAAHWRALCESTPRVLVVVGSCGAQLLRALAPVTPPGVRIEALGLGPVAWGTARGLELAILGARDVVARPFVRALGCPVVIVDGVGHMGYLGSLAVRERARAWVQQRLEAAP